MSLLQRMLWIGILTSSSQSFNWRERGGLTHSPWLQQPTELTMTKVQGAHGVIHLRWLLSEMDTVTDHNLSSEHLLQELWRFRAHSGRF